MTEGGETGPDRSRTRAREQEAMHGRGGAAPGGIVTPNAAPNAAFLLPGLGLALRHLPPAMVQPAVAFATRALADRHPELFRRLASLGAAEILVDPSDLPLVFVVRPGAAPPEVRALARMTARGLAPAATIRGPLETLVALLEGRIDGDAAFFSRALTIEGDTAAVLTLRNAIDSAEVNLVDDFCALLGPLAGPSRRSLALAERLSRAAARDFDRGRRLLLGPALESCQQLGGQMNNLAREVEDLRGELRVLKRRTAGKTS